LIVTQRKTVKTVKTMVFHFNLHDWRGCVKTLWL